mmetsp:Transcript_15829/g.25846  ORF Transcript_15829/g.25846 Transcript_15829/m.25846 type:complete len:237 (+) Transcript_15829:64-774(+)
MKGSGCDVQSADLVGHPVSGQGALAEAAVADVPAAGQPAAGQPAGTEVTVVDLSQAPVAVAVPVDVPATGAIYYKNADDELKSKTSNRLGVSMLFINAGTNNVQGEARFVVPHKMKFMSILGGQSMDLSNATFVHSETYITVGSLLGGCTITVPRGVRVVNRGIGLLGGFDAAAAGSEVNTPLEDMPTIYLKGATLLASAKVCVNEEVNPVYVIDKGSSIVHNENGNGNESTRVAL